MLDRERGTKHDQTGEDQGPTDRASSEGPDPDAGDNNRKGQ